MPIGEKQRPEAVVSVTAEDPEPPKKKKDKAEENLAQARKELKDNTELVRDLVSPGAAGRFTREATWRRRGLLRPSTRLTFAHSLQSEEDASLKAELEMLVERLSESDSNLHRPALESLRTLIRTSTSSMTSVPKPLKFLRPHYAQLQQIHASWPDHSPAKQDGDAVPASVTDKGLFADILSVLAMTYADSGKRETLMYRLKGGSNEDPGLWGHEYVRHLAAELGEEYTQYRQEERAVDELVALGLRLVPFLLTHNAESDAVDLLLELESISKIVDYVDANTYQRVCLYMVSMVYYLTPPDDLDFLRTAHEIYKRHKCYTEALTLALRLQDTALIQEDFEAPTNPHMKRQLAYILARQQVNVPTDDEALTEILNNTKLSESFKRFGKELSVTEPKSLEDIYKSHLENTRGPAQVDSARQNLAGTFVNAFVNAGFGNDKLMVEAEEGQSWIYKNKDHGMFSAAASLGLSLLWDTDVGLSHIDKYAYASEDHIKAGAMLANGLIHSGVRTEMDAALALLSEHVEAPNAELRVAAIIGIGIAYAGSQREDIRDLLLPTLQDSAVSMEVASMAALALGFVFVGSCDEDVTMGVVSTMMERDEAQLKEKWGRFLALGVALLYLGRTEQSEATIEVLKTIEAPLGKVAITLVQTLSYAATGNVVQIQALLREATDHLDPEKESDLHQAMAVIGVALIAMGEEVGSQMSVRHFNHLMHYGSPVVRRAVPLALGLISASNPVLSILETLSRYSHDNDLDVALNAIFAMGLVGAGTNNAKLAQMLRQLATYYHKEPDCLFMVRIAQGLVHMGKGTIGVNPFHTDRSLMSPVAVCGLLATLVSFTDPRGFILDKSHWMLYFLTMAMYPRFLITLSDETDELLPATVRVGQAVDVVGQAGKPRTISGFQTHTTPVRLGHTERAEMATEEYIPYSHVLEGYVILAKNKGFEKNEDEMDVTK
ncbi:26S proteasome regulatory complex, non-ATPase subcomplex, Rpn1 subunit [Rhodotorula sp. JG-1b]|nr:26S proteasome regulatory complex, non-ATPase subcomplex, Rpn1 subunit [Rhodotorula sp. JG-1b]